MTNRRRFMPWLLALFSALIFGIWLVISLQRADRQREAVRKLGELGAVVAYDYQLDPSRETTRTSEAFRKAFKNIAERGDLPDPDHDGLAWLRRIVGKAKPSCGQCIPTATSRPIAAKPVPRWILPDFEKIRAG